MKTLDWIPAYAGMTANWDFRLFYETVRLEIKKRCNKIFYCIVRRVFSIDSHTSDCDFLYIQNQ